MALGEDLLLLAIPARGGRVRATDRIGFALRASVLLDLTIAGRIAMVGRRIEVVDPTPVDDKRVNNALIVLCDSDPVPSLGAWVRQTPRGNAMWPASDSDRALAGLVHACGLDHCLYRAPFGLRAHARLAGFSQQQVAETAQKARAATDAALSEAVAQALPDGLAHVTREPVNLMRYEYYYDNATGAVPFDNGQSWPL